MQIRRLLAGRDSLRAENAFLHGGVAERLSLDDLAVAKGEDIGFLGGFPFAGDLSQYDDDITVGEKGLRLCRGGLLR